MKSGAYKILRAIWIALTIVVLVWSQSAYDGRPNSDADVLQLVLMFALSFPASFVAGAICVVIAFCWEYLAHAPFSTSRPEMFLVWLLFAISGYVQWFILLPRALAIWKRKRQPAN